MALRHLISSFRALALALAMNALIGSPSIAQLCQSELAVVKDYQAKIVAADLQVVAFGTAAELWKQQYETLKVAYILASLQYL